MKNVVKIYFLIFFLIGCETIMEGDPRYQIIDKPYYRMTPISEFSNTISEIIHKIELSKIRGSKYSPIDDLEELEKQVIIAKDIYHDNVQLIRQKIRIFNTTPGFMRLPGERVGFISMVTKLNRYGDSITFFKRELKRIIEKIKAIEETHKNKRKIQESSILKRFERRV